jgi:hypothetical protein
MLSEVSQAASIDRPAFSTLDRLVNRLRIEVRVCLHDDPASHLAAIRHNADLINPAPDVPPALLVVAFLNHFAPIVSP